MRLNFEPSVTVVKKGHGHGLLPQDCVCCRRSLSNHQSLELLDCCSTAHQPKVAHQTCLSQALQPVTKTITRQNPDGTMVASTMVEAAHCPSCGSRMPLHSAISSSVVGFIEAMDVSLAAQVQTQLPLKDVVHLINGGWRQVNFLARYGSQLPTEHIILLLRGESLLNGDAKRKAILHDLVRYHREAIFQYILNQCDARETWKLVAHDEILKPMRKNFSSVQLTQLLIAKLFKDRVCLDPIETEGKLMWKAFVKNAAQRESLIAALVGSDLIEHKVALAHVYRHGIIASHKHSIAVSVADAFKYYWQIIKMVMSQRAIPSDHLALLEEACGYVADHIDKGQMDTVTYFIQAVHLLASNRKKVDQLLQFTYKDLLTRNRGVTAKDFLNAYATLKLRGMRVACQTSEGVTPLHLVARYWPAAGIGCQNIKTVMQTLIDNQVDINGQDQKHERALHHFCQYACESQVLTSNERVELLQWFINANAVANVTNKAGKTPLQYVCEIWLQAGMEQNNVITAVHALAAKTDLKQHAIILRIIIEQWCQQKMDAQKLVDMVVYLLRAGADANHGVNNLQPLLHVVAQRWVNLKIDINLVLATLEQLLNAGADINARDAAQNTLLNLVCQGWPEVPDRVLSLIDQLKQRGARTDIANALGDLPIHSIFMVWPKIANLEQIKAALTALVPANSIDRANLAGETLLHKVCGSWVQQVGVPFELIAAVVALLFERGANAYVQNKNLDTPLHLVCQLGQLTNGEAMMLCRALLEKAPSMINAANITNTTPLHLFARGWMKNVSKDVFDNGSIIEYFKEFLRFGANVNAADSQLTTPLHEFAYHWIRQGASLTSVLGLFRELKAQGANMNAISTVYHNLVMIIAREWLKYLGAEQTLYVLKELENIGVDTRVMDLSDQQGMTPFLCVAKNWLQQGASYAVMLQTLQWMVKACKATPDQKDGEGKNILFYFLDDWILRKGENQNAIFTDLFELAPHLDVNATDASRKTVLHHLFEKGGNSLAPVQLWNFVELMHTHRANFNLADNAGCTPIFYLFTHWNQINSEGYFDSMLKRFEECGASFDVENKQGITLLHLAAKRASQQIFAYVLEKFPSSERVIAYAATTKFEQSLLGCLTAETRDVDAKFVRLSYYLITANLPLALESAIGQNIWRHLQKLNRVADFDRVMCTDASPEQVMALARFYRDTQIVKKVADLPLAHVAYETVLRKLFTGTDYLFRPTHFVFVDEIHEFGRNIFKRNDFITDAERAALAMLFADDTVTKGLSEFEKLSKKFLLRSASMFACIVLARHYETGLMLPMADAKRALNFYILANDMERPAGELDRFLGACRQCAIDGIERLSDELEEASEYLLGYFAKQQRLDMAQDWYAKMLNKTPKVKAMMGKLCVDLGHLDKAIELYHYIPALMTRAEAGCKSNQFAQAIKDYCRILLLARDDPKIHKIAVDALLKMRAEVLKDQACGVAIVDVMINVIERGHYDRSMVDKLLSAFAMERLFSDKACQKQKQVPTLFKPLNNFIEANQRVYNTRYAEIYLHIMSDALYERFKQRLQEGGKQELVVELLNAIAAGDSPIPPHLLNQQFNNRICELQAILPKVSSHNSNN